MASRVNVLQKRFIRAYRSLRSRLIRAPASVPGIEERGRAELIQGVLVVRVVAIVLLYGILASVNQTGMEMIAGVVVFTAGAYVLSRTRFYQLAAAGIMVEPILGVPAYVNANHGSVYILISAPIWLGLGTFMSSLIFKPRFTLALMALTAASFACIGLNTEPAYRAAVASEFLAVMVSSALALISNTIRQRNENILRGERAKVVHASKLASLGEMAAGIAHELNSPLGAVLLNIEMSRELLRAPSANVPLASARLDAAIATVERMAKIIKGLKSFSRDSEGEPLEAVTIGSWIDATADLCRAKMLHHRVDLKIDPTDLERIIPVQPVQTSQVLLNLMNNALDAILEAPERWIEIRVRAGARGPELVVRDSGHGISEDVVAKLFQPFFTTKDYGTGTGLGLSISRGIMQAQGGDLEYEPGPRTTFVMRLPAAVVAPSRAA